METHLSPYLHLPLPIYSMATSVIFEDCKNLVEYCLPCYNPHEIETYGGKESFLLAGAAKLVWQFENRGSREEIEAWIVSTDASEEERKESAEELGLVLVEQFETFNDEFYHSEQFAIEIIPRIIAIYRKCWDNGIEGKSQEYYLEKNKADNANIAEVICERYKDGYLIVLPNNFVIHQNVDGVVDVYYVKADVARLLTLDEQLAAASLGMRMASPEDCTRVMASLK